MLLPQLSYGIKIIRAGGIHCITSVSQIIGMSISVSATVGWLYRYNKKPYILHSVIAPTSCVTLGKLLNLTEGAHLARI
jgi:hypothetical protein